MKVIKDADLESRLYADLERVGITTDFEFKFKSYSSSYWGRYFINKKLVVIYVEDENAERYAYTKILGTAIHEAIHHYQHHHNPYFKRIKGIMHDVEFRRLYEQYCKELGVEITDE